MTIEMLIPQPSENTPITVDNYPYGWNKRTKAQYWIETVERKGQRVVFRTFNPHTRKFNKVKKSTYSDIVVLYRNLENNHIENEGLTFAYTDQKRLDEFLSKFPEDKLSNWQRSALITLRAIINTRKHFTVKISSPRNHHEETMIEESNKEASKQMREVFKYYLYEELKKEK